MNSFESGLWILFGSLIKICFPLFSSLPSPAKGAIFGANWNPPFAQMTSLTQPGVLQCIRISLGLSLCKNTRGGVLTVKICKI